MPDDDYAKLGQVENEASLGVTEFFKQIPTEFPTFEEFFDGKLTYSDVLAAMECDAKLQQKVFDCIMDAPDLSVCYTSVSAFLKMVNGKQVWKLPEEEQIKRVNTLVQSAAQHFEKSIRDFNYPLERLGVNADSTGATLQRRVAFPNLIFHFIAPNIYGNVT
ncbi:MAG: hypothetical protein LBK82_02875 [Planctomycetaceae bacterium]|jgi:hypothetical protein|nr:hypothetical protein [Planctomycetaceae bacterium]